MPKQLPDILAEVQALSTIGEDQFEASLATVVSDLEAYISANPSANVPSPRTVTSLSIGFSDGGSQAVTVSPSTSGTAAQASA